MNSTNETQAAIWNGPAGHGWVAAQATLDGMFAPFDVLLANEVRESPRHLLDIGCGTGGTTLAFARRFGKQCWYTGIDISAPMLERACQRAQAESVAVDFVQGDAQTHAFAAASFDLLISRFGVMFFADPVAAFTNLRRAAMPGARLRAVTFRSPAENPFMLTAERAAQPYLPALPKRAAAAPGQFAFADATRVRGILEAGGWSGIDLEPVDVVCTFPETALELYLTRLGPVGLVLAQAAEATRLQALAAVRAAFQTYVHGAEVRFTAACWMVRAHA
jgi:SAM-dependent methyltransferase